MFKETLFFRVICFVVMLSVATSAIASEIKLPEPGAMVELSEAFELPNICGINFNPADPFNLEFIIDQGTDNKVSVSERQKLVRYFLAALTIPEDKLWVNLSPYEADRVIDETTGQTEIGDVLLAQDYVLKQLAASLTHPDSKTGADYWAKSSQDDLSKIWISPKKVSLYDNNNTLFITETKLKVESEENTQSTLIPAIEKDVNQGRNFAELRQMMNSIILAQWFKRKFAKSLYKFYFNSEKITGVDLGNPATKNQVFNRYVEAFNKGAYNVIKKEIENGRKTKRKYFSGGISSAIDSESIEMVPTVEMVNFVSKEYLALPIAMMFSPNNQAAIEAKEFFNFEGLQKSVQVLGLDQSNVSSFDDSFSAMASSALFHQLKEFAALNTSEINVFDLDTLYGNLGNMIHQFPQQYIKKAITNVIDKIDAFFQVADEGTQKQQKEKIAEIAKALKSLSKIKDPNQNNVVASAIEEFSSIEEMLLPVMAEHPYMAEQLQTIMKLINDVALATDQASLDQYVAQFALSFEELGKNSEISEKASVVCSALSSKIKSFYETLKESNKKRKELFRNIRMIIFSLLVFAFQIVLLAMGIVEFQALSFAWFFAPLAVLGTFLEFFAASILRPGYSEDGFTHYLSATYMKLNSVDNSSVASRLCVLFYLGFRKGVYDIGDLELLKDNASGISKRIKEKADLDPQQLKNPEFWLEFLDREDQNEILESDIDTSTINDLKAAIQKSRAEFGAAIAGVAILNKDGTFKLEPKHANMTVYLAVSFISLNAYAQDYEKTEKDLTDLNDANLSLPQINAENFDLHEIDKWEHLLDKGIFYRFFMKSRNSELVKDLNDKLKSAKSNKSVDVRYGLISDEVQSASSSSLTVSQKSIKEELENRFDVALASLKIEGESIDLDDYVSARELYEVGLSFERSKYDMALDGDLTKRKVFDEGFGVYIRGMNAMVEKMEGDVNGLSMTGSSSVDNLMASSSMDMQAMVNDARVILNDHIPVNSVKTSGIEKLLVAIKPLLYSGETNEKTRARIINEFKQLTHLKKAKISLILTLIILIPFDPKYNNLFKDTKKDIFASSSIQQSTQKINLAGLRASAVFDKALTAIIAQKPELASALTPVIEAANQFAFSVGADPLQQEQALATLSDSLRKLGKSNVLSTKDSSACSSLAEIIEEIRENVVEIRKDDVVKRWGLIAGALFVVSFSVYFILKSTGVLVHPEDSYLPIVFGGIGAVGLLLVVIARFFTNDEFKIHMKAYLGDQIRDKMSLSNLSVVAYLALQEGIWSLEDFELYSNMRTSDTSRLFEKIESNTKDKINTPEFWLEFISQEDQDEILKLNSELESIKALQTAVRESKSYQKKWDEQEPPTNPLTADQKKREPGFVGVIPNTKDFVPESPQKKWDESEPSTNPLDSSSSAIYSESQKVKQASSDVEQDELIASEKRRARSVEIALDNMSKAMDRLNDQCAYLQNKREDASLGDVKAVMDRNLNDVATAVVGYKVALSKIDELIKRNISDFVDSNEQYEWIALYLENFRAQKEANQRGIETVLAKLQELKLLNENVVSYDEEFLDSMRLAFDLITQHESEFMNMRISYNHIENFLSQVNLYQDYGVSLVCMGSYFIDYLLWKLGSCRDKFFKKYNMVSDVIELYLERHKQLVEASKLIVTEMRLTIPGVQDDDILFDQIVESVEPDNFVYHLDSLLEEESEAEVAKLEEALERFKNKKVSDLSFGEEQSLIQIMTDLYEKQDARLVLYKKVESEYLLTLLPEEKQWEFSSTAEQMLLKSELPKRSSSSVELMNVLLSVKLHDLSDKDVNRVNAKVDEMLVGETDPNKRNVLGLAKKLMVQSVALSADDYEGHAQLVRSTLDLLEFVKILDGVPQTFKVLSSALSKDIKKIFQKESDHSTEKAKMKDNQSNLNIFAFFFAMLLVLLIYVATLEVDLFPLALTFVAITLTGFAGANQLGSVLRNNYKNLYLELGQQVRNHLELAKTKDEFALAALAGIQSNVVNVDQIIYLLQLRKKRTDTEDIDLMFDGMDELEAELSNSIEQEVGFGLFYKHLSDTVKLELDKLNIKSSQTLDTIKKEIKLDISELGRKTMQDNVNSSSSAATQVDSYGGINLKGMLNGIDVAEAGADIQISSALAANITGVTFKLIGQGEVLPLGQIIQFPVVANK